MVWAVVLRTRPGEVGIIGANFTDGDNGRGPRRRGVAKGSGICLGLASGVPGCIFGIDKEPIFIARSQRGERMAGGRLGQDGRGNVVGAREVVIKVPRSGWSRIPGHGNGVGRFRRHAEVGRRRRLRRGVCGPVTSAGSSASSARPFPGKSCGRAQTQCKREYHGDVVRQP
jgi:hypothetical protein